MTSDVLSKLDELKDAVEDEDSEQALTVLSNLQDAYDEQAAAERPHIERAKKLTRGNMDDTPKQVMSFLQETTAAQMNRAGALIAVKTSLAYPEETDEDILKLIEALEERERSVAAATETVSDELATVTLPAFPFVLKTSTPEVPVGKGSSTDVSATVLNVGDEAVTGLSSTVQISDGLSVIDGPSVSDEIAPDESTEVLTTLRAESAGDYTVTIEVAGDSGRDGVQTAQLEVFTKGSFVDRIRRQVDQLRTRVAEATPPSGGQQRELISKLDAVLERLQKAEHHIERSEPKKANNMLNAASRQLGGFINDLEANGRNNDGNKIPEHRRIAFIEAASESIELLSAAQNANI